MKTRTSRAASSSFGLWGMAVVLLMLAGLGAAGTLWATGYFRSAAPPSREGQVAFPALVRPIKAYEAVTRDDLLNPETRQLNVIWVPKEQASEKAVRDLGQILGRVVTRDKGAGYILSENDFLPKGTRPGLTAGVPPGKRSVTIAIDRVPGLELLRQGDAFDLMAVLPPREATESNVEQAALLGGIKPPDTRAGQLARQTGVKPLVVAGTMIAHTQGKSQTTTGASALVVPPAGGRTPKSAAVHATIAVDPEEVTPLTEALGGLDIKLFCVARSGHPESTDGKAPAFSTAGLVPVLATARAVSAYSAIGAEDLADDVTGRLNVYYFPEDKVETGWLTNYSDLLGRVVSRDVANGAILTESDLLPKGSRPGVAAAAPAGTVVVMVDPDSIEGLDQLQRGDQFRLLSRLGGNLRPTLPTTDWAALHGGVLPEEDQRIEQELRTGVRTVTDQGTFLGLKDSQAAIAVPQAEAVRVSQVLNGDHDLFAVVRSGRDQERLAEEAPAARPARSPVGPRADRAARRDGTTFVDAEADAASSQVDVQGEDLVNVPVLVRPVRAFDELQVDDFVDPATGKLRIVRFPKDSPAALAANEIRDLLGRVLKRSRKGGEVVFMGDLFPQGTRPGVSAGIPPGWTAVRVTSLEVRGLAMVSEGDVLDLVAARPIGSGTLQQAEIWPARNQEGTFAQSQSEDVFLQADVNVLARDARILSREDSEVEIEVREKTETAADESELGDVITRKSVSRVERPRVVARKAVICTVAVPAESVTLITEALAVQSVVDQADGQGATGEERPGRDGRTLEREVALFAILRSSNPETTADSGTIPPKDIVAEWNRRWSERFTEYLDALSKETSSVQPVEHLRGAQRTQEYWRNGRPSVDYPQREVTDGATGRLLRDSAGRTSGSTP